MTDKAKNLLNAHVNSPADHAPSPQTDENKNRLRNTIIKFSAVTVFMIMVIVFASLGWFAVNKASNTSGGELKVNGAPYVIETRTDHGYYKDVYEKITSDSAEWKISAAHNFDNHESAKETGETEPALEPGDHGSLEFRVSPQSADSITVDCEFEVKVYSEDTVTENGETKTIVNEINNNEIVGYMEAHIMLFSGYDETTGKYSGLIDDNVEFKRILEDQTFSRGGSTYTTIYWYWPEHLSDLTDSSNIKYVSSESTKVLAYVARNKDKFFKGCKDDTTKVLSDLTSLYENNPSQLYNYYSLKYDTADLVIGNNVSYMMLSMKIKTN